MSEIPLCYSRELSTASSQCSDELSETDRLQRRISELNEQLEKREYKLAELVKVNNELQLRYEQLSESSQNQLLVKSNSPAASSGTVDTVTEEYTQRLSALEKRFQQSIRERDQLREQLKVARQELDTRIKRDVYDSELKEKDFVINELRLEGGKLSKEVLHHSNIIKKLRAKEKENDEIMRRQSDQIREQQDELDRMKRSVSAREDVERAQIEAVNQLALVKKKLESENGDLKSRLDDALQKLEALTVSFSATKQELVDQTKIANDLKQKSSSLETRFENQSEEMQKNLRSQKEVADLREKLKQVENGANTR